MHIYIAGKFSRQDFEKLAVRFWSNIFKEEAEITQYSIVQNFDGGNVLQIWWMDTELSKFSLPKFRT